MRLFIRIVDGKPFEHPIVESNFREAFPEIDVDNLPSDFAEFIRHPEPEIGPYQIYQGVNYEWIDGKVQDDHLIYQMTAEEISEKQSVTILNWNNSGGYASWVFNEVKCEFEPPVPYPQDGKIYIWKEEIINWEEIYFNNGGQ